MDARRPLATGPVLLGNRLLLGGHDGSLSSIETTVNQARLMRFLTLAFCFCLCCAAARADAPLYEQDPFDQITLDEANGNALLKVKPLELPGRRVPVKPGAHRQAGPPLRRSAGKEVRSRLGLGQEGGTFEQMLLAKANELLAADKLDEAYGYLRFLEESYPNLPDLAAASETYLFQQAKAFYGKQQYRNALGVLRDLHRRDPQRPSWKAPGRHDGKAGGSIRRRGRFSFHPRAGPRAGPLVSRSSAGGEMADAVEGPGRGGVGCRPCRGGRGRLSQGGRGSSAMRPSSGRNWKARGTWPAMSTPSIPAWSSASARAGGQRRPAGDLLTDWAARRDARLVCRQLSRVCRRRPPRRHVHLPRGRAEGR